MVIVIKYFIKGKKTAAREPNCKLDFLNAVYNNIPFCIARPLA